MANQKILLKRSATQYKIPTTSQLQLGEIGLNTYDGKLFIEKDVSGTASIVELGVGPTFQLTSGGSPAHTHSVSITGQQALDLLNGTATTITVRSSDEGHTHDITIKYSTTEKGFILNNSSSITSNHTTAHTLAANGGGASKIENLNDVDTTNIANNKILKYNSSSSKWECVDDSTGTTINKIRDITNVNISADPTHGHILSWNNSTKKWDVGAPTGGVNYTNGTTTPTSPALGDEFFNTTNDVLYKYVNDGTTSAWLDISTDSVVSVAVINDVGDVDTATTAPTSGQVLKWDGSNWTPADDTDTTLSLGTAVLTDLGDVNTGATNGQVLKWDSTTSKWVPSADTNTTVTYSTSIPASTTKIRLTGSDSTTDDIELAGSGATTITRDTDSKITINSTDTTYPNLTNIGDVNTGATNGQVLKWDSATSKWAPSDDSAGVVQDLATTTVGTTLTNLDTWNKTTYVSAKYTITTKVGSKYSVSEVLVLSKGTSVEITEYGLLGDSILTVSADISGSNVRLRAQSTDASTSVKLTKILQGV